MYKTFAFVYDELMAEFDYDGLVEIYSSLVPLQGRILEMGCGSGRFSEKVLARSTSYLAMDISEEMLTLASRRLGHRSGLSFLLDTGEPFSGPLDLVLAAVDVVNYMDEENLHCFLSRSYEALMPGGMVIFDISTERKLRETLHDQIFVFERDTFTLIWQNSFSPEDGGVFFDLTMFLKRGDTYIKEKETQFQRAWRREELEEILIQCGFSDIKMIATIDREIFSAQKKYVQL